MVNRLSGLSFIDAQVGLKMGSGKDGYPNTDSDIYGEFLSFRLCDTGFMTTHLQAVNYLFDWVFGIQNGTMFYFEQGGNAQINNAQLSYCALAVRIDGGCKNSGTYQFNNMRCEGWRPDTKADNRGRCQILKVNPIEQAVVRFTNFDDVQWNWNKYSPEEQRVPLLDIGPGATVVFETSIFSGYTAHVDGTESKPGVLKLVNCHLNNIGLPEAITASEFGYFQAVQMRGPDGGKLLPDMIKWPDIKPTILSPDQIYDVRPSQQEKP